jgi:transcription initiation factor TFIID TATA-box-binding protein
MESIQTHPSTAVQAKNFVAPGSLSFPGGAGELTPPSNEFEKMQVNGNGGKQHNGQVLHGNGVTPATPAATPGATQGVSGIVPTLQYV